ncbi:hypothetical protein KIPB_009690 [Kipferlia bialata]|uniref:Uncharacterized protein n=1 Tax=Kipferlia bialata TaxID=797122 RepID=A0A9K3GMG2_9EUKA|nr:hypothetical protein KIPB_009690 [Kipferlia bialata]|eukprot:g9690.t1
MAKKGGKRDRTRVRKSQVGTRPASSVKTPGSTEAKQRKREKNLEIQTARQYSVAETRRVNQLFQLHPLAQGRVPVPDFCQEYLSSGVLPPGVSRGTASAYLAKAYEIKRCLPELMEAGYMQHGFQPPMEAIMHRIGGPLNAGWYFDAPIPSVCGDGSPPSIKSVYQSKALRHNFTNQTPSAQRLHTGTTHVAVGFVDLSMLLFADIQEGEAESEGVLSFVGYEMCPYAVAKTMVLWHIITHWEWASQADHIDRVLQVWFSSAWEASTALAFQEAAALVLSSDADTTPAVRAILTHWADPPHTVTLSAAREAWLGLHPPENATSAACLLREVDRLAVAEYALTGDFALPASSSADSLVGSTCMYGCPKSAPPSASSESVFSVVPLSSIAGEAQGEVSVVEAVRRVLAGRLGSLLDRCKRGGVTVSVHEGDVTDPRVVAAIRDQSPSSMSWSNVLDYVARDDFHRLAQECGGEDCAHSGYSMNWSTVVKGTSLLEYSMWDDPTRRRDILECAHASEELDNWELGLCDHLRSPLPSNPLNASGHLLQHLLYRVWVGTWAPRGGVEWVHAHMGEATPLSLTGGGTVHLRWGYSGEGRVEEQGDLPHVNQCWRNIELYSGIQGIPETDCFGILAMMLTDLRDLRVHGAVEFSD